MSLNARMTAVATLLSAMCAVLIGCVAQPRALLYAPAQERVSGIVVFEEHWGPPNFGENPATDLRTRLPVLHLDTFIRVKALPGDTVNSYSRDSVYRLGLVGVITEDSLRYSGKHVVLEGTLFLRETANQPTAVMMDVERVVHGPS